MTPRSFIDLLPEHLRPKTKKLTKTVWIRKGKKYIFSRKEDVVHFECIEFLRENYPDVLVQSNHNNGMSLKRTGQKFNPLIRNISLLNGTPGMSDIILIHEVGQYKGLALELKSPGQYPTPEEKAVLSKMEKQGYMALCSGGKGCKTLEDSVKESLEIIKNYMEGM